MIAVLGVCKRDLPLAVKWLKWTLGLEDGWRKLMVVVTADFSKEDEMQLIRAGDGTLGFLLKKLPDLHEVGYPGSASHLFLRSLELAGQYAPGEPILWLEPDAIPIEDGWFTAIEKEYHSNGTPFMGHLELKAQPPHMAGVAVYPPNWDELAPRIREAWQAPDHKAWGKGCAQAWDMWAAPEILPLASQATTIQQVWKCPPFTLEMLNTIVWPTTMLFHQSKDGRLIELLKATKPRRWTL